MSCTFKGNCTLKEVRVIKNKHYKSEESYKNNLKEFIKDIKPGSVFIENPTMCKQMSEQNDCSPRYTVYTI
jgi:hypothetical protein